MARRQASSEEKRVDLSRARRAVLVVDVVESVRLMRQDEIGFIERWRLFVAEVRSALLAPHGARLVKSLGDGLLIECVEPGQAFALSQAMLLRIAPINGARPDAERIELRIGLQVCDVVKDTLDIYGSGVNLAARLAGLAGPSQIVMSAEFLAAMAGQVDESQIEDLGLCYLKHIEEPVRAYRTLKARAAAGTPGMATEHRHTGPEDTFDGSAPTVAVLRFKAADPGAESTVVAELLADALTSRLAACQGLRVISRFSASTLDGETTSGTEAWKALRAHYVVRGRIVGLAHRLVAVVELVDTSAEQVLWGGRQPFEVGDLLSPNDEPSAHLAGELARQIVTATMRRARTAALPTLDGNMLQFSASSMMHERDHDAFGRAHALLEHLIERFPRQPSPRAWTAMWHVLQVTRGFEHDPTRIANRALDHVNRALDHDPECSLAIAMAGFVHCHLLRDLTAADALLERAVTLNPSEAWAWLFRSVVAGHRGLAQDAWSWATRASALSPLDPLGHYFDALRSTAAVAAERWPDAVRLARRSLAVNGDHLPTLRGLTIALVALEQIDEARALAGRILTVDAGFTLQAYLASAPPEGMETRRRYVDALQRAGLPMH